LIARWLCDKKFFLRGSIHIHPNATATTTTAKLNSGRKEGNAMQFELEIQKAYRYRKISGLTEPGGLVWYGFGGGAMR